MSNHDALLSAIPTPTRTGEGHPSSNLAVSVVTAPDGSRAAYWEPNRGPRSRRKGLSSHQGTTVADIQRMAAESQLLEGKIRGAVHHARELGVTWALIGFSLGLDPSGARRRFGEPGEVLAGDLIAAHTVANL